MINVLKIRNLMRVVMVSSALLFAMGGTAAFASVDINGNNDTTGPNSVNHNDWKIESEYDLEVQNDADVDNNTKIEVLTGDNLISCNTEVENITTGDISGEFVVKNELNNGFVDLIDGNWGLADIAVDLTNDTTGPHSENINHVDVERDADVNIKNDTDIDNRLRMEANTGDNRVENNTIVGDVTTGDIDIKSKTVNTANTSNFQLPDNGNVEISGDFTNELTGPSSENINELKVEEDLDVDIKNEVDIDNDSQVEANTGHNHVGNNTVVGDITTGSVNLDFQTTNTAN